MSYWLNFFRKKKTQRVHFHRTEKGKKNEKKKPLCLMHVVSDDCTSIFSFFLFSVESRRARITGLVNALSDHFTSFFVT